MFPCIHIFNLHDYEIGAITNLILLMGKRRFRDEVTKIAWGNPANAKQCIFVPQPCITVPYS